MAAASEVGARPGSLIAAVGHRFWRDFSTGPVWLDRLATLDWPAGVTLDDFSFGALAMVQRLEAEPFERIFFLTAEAREREPGSLHLRRYRPENASPEHVQACIAEAGGGVVAIDLLLVIGEHFGVLPAETWVLEAEPFDVGWGDGLSAPIETLYPRALALVRWFADGRSPEEADDPRTARDTRRDSPGPLLDGR